MIHWNTLIWGGISGVVVFAVLACSTVPGTDRERLNFMPESQMNQLGDQAFASMLEQKDVVTSGSEVNRIDRIGHRLAQSARQLYPSASLPQEWEIVIIDDDTPNAFALPGGSIGVHTGMIELAENDDAIGVVIGHEIGHVIAAHSAERMSHQLLLAGGIALGSAALQDQDEGTRQVVLAAMGVGASVGAMLPYSRLHESEADELGLMIAANAGFDPREAVGLWQRMGKENSGRLEFLSTHPLPRTRIEDFQAIMPRAMSLYRRSDRR
jgi:predicted Zn-dependent protease